MAINVKITSESKERGLWHASGTVTNPDGSEKGKAKVLVQADAKGPRLALSKDIKSIILGNEVSEYKSYDGPTAEQAPVLEKDVELIFSNLLFAI